MSNFDKGVADFTKKLKSIIKEASKGKGLDVIGNIVIDIIRRRTRSGQGVDGGRKTKLKPLSKKYIEFRKRNRGRLSPFASPGKSNLTFTGQMLNGLVKKKVPGGVVVTFDSDRNKRVAGFVSSARPFMELANEEVEEVTKTFRKYFSSLVRSGR